MEALADEGNSAAAYELYKLLEFQHGTISTAWNWLCMAANASNGEAQAEVGYFHRTVIWKGLSSNRKGILQVAGVEPDDKIAYMWYTLAMKNGYNDAANARNYVMEIMNPEEIAQAAQMARDWKPGDCPSAEHRLGVPGET